MRSSSGYSEACCELTSIKRCDEIRVGCADYMISAQPTGGEFYRTFAASYDNGLAIENGPKRCETLLPIKQKLTSAFLHEGRGELAHEIFKDEAVGVAFDLRGARRRSNSCKTLFGSPTGWAYWSGRSALLVQRPSAPEAAARRCSH